MSVPRKMQEFAALYGCEIVEKPTYDGYRLYAQANGNEAMLCLTYEARDVDLNNLKDVLQRVSGRTLAQFWTGR
jgi:hypothetical protein